LPSSWFCSTAYVVYNIDASTGCLSYIPLSESSSDSSLSFGEFVEVITTFSCFEKKELLRYFFYILDNRHTGLIEKVSAHPHARKRTRRY
jgi:hypothetical protein